MLQPYSILQFKPRRFRDNNIYIFSHNLYFFFQCTQIANHEVKRIRLYFLFGPGYELLRENHFLLMRAA